MGSMIVGSGLLGMKSEFPKIMSQLKTPEDKSNLVNAVREWEYGVNPANLGVFSNQLLADMYQTQPKQVAKPAVSSTPEPKTVEPAPQMEGRVPTVNRKTPSRGRTILDPLSGKNEGTTYRKKLLGD